MVLCEFPGCPQSPRSLLLRVEPAVVGTLVSSEVSPVGTHGYLEGVTTGVVNFDHI